MPKNPHSRLKRFPRRIRHLLRPPPQTTGSDAADGRLAHGSAFRQLRKQLAALLLAAAVSSAIAFLCLHFCLETV